ncbi:hypothetical protein [Candidatus Viridilinea mediisalina]|uniref:Polysaccharide chain length determinant N-terminal domain-containing protein n=1 Tax=Candidatus Viridilinea mediisalina TaxID=2024553 RepID=A0A2A6RLW2_9CHLR|nr:hypothetical protein [Candidatus Viridilinea mediisalina]PDW03915.1 hypothetical protein CJ255_06050 [Candidatus Viridilinea mediisalina]
MPIQLRTYIAIMLRFWPLLLLLPLVTGGVSLAMGWQRPVEYEVTTRMLVTQARAATYADVALPELAAGASWAASSYILDDLPSLLTSATFASDLVPLLEAAGQPLEGSQIQHGLRPTVHHRAVTLRARAPTPESARALVVAAVQALEQGGLRYWGQTQPGGLQVALLDPPGTAIPIGGTRALIGEVGLRMLLALAIGVGLAFLAHYLDDRLYTTQQAEEWIGAEVLVVIPKEIRK